MGKHRTQWLSREQVDAMRKSYHAAIRLNGGRLPHGWPKELADAMGRNYQTVYAYIRLFKREPRPREVVEQPLPPAVNIEHRCHFDHSAAMRGGGSLGVVHASKWEMD